MSKYDKMGSWVVGCLLVCCMICYGAPVKVQPVPVEQAKQLLQDLGSGAPAAPPTAKIPDLNAVPLTGWEGTAGYAPGYFEQMTSSFARNYDRHLVATPLPPYERAGHISLGQGWSDRLDTPPCSVTTAPDTSLSYFPGVQPGDAYKIWFNPDLNCPSCTTPYPFRVDEVTFLLVQDDGSPLDTVYLGIDIECARFDPLDSCRGPGMERCFNAYYVILPWDTVPDGFLQVWTLTLPFDSCWVDGPFFLSLWHLGHTQADTSYFPPNIALDGARVPPVTNCTAWANLSGAWERWADVWNPPGPGYPPLTLYGECNAPNPPAITPCPEMCAQQRWGGSYAYYDPTTFGVWQWFAAGADLQFPYKPMSLDFSLYYVGAGAVTDSVFLLITYGCSRFDDVCCAPSDVLCAGTIWLQRGSTANPFQLPVSLDLSGMTCCLPEDFWVGVTIVQITAGVVPSFLYSAAVSEPPIPPCEQWLLDAAGYGHMPQGAVGWADLVLGGACGDCGGEQTDTCHVYGNETLNCANATPVSCGHVVLTGQTNSGGNSNVTQYCCVPWDESGPEKVYSVVVPAGHNLSATLSNLVGGDLDVFILSACNPHNCIVGGDNVANAEHLAAGTYYIVVDGYAGDVATFDLTVDCFFPCAPTQCRASLLGGVQGTTTRYLDGEWDATMAGVADTVYYMYYPGTLSLQYILKWSATTCDTFRRIGWTSADASTCRMLAADPRGYFWTGTITNFTTGTGRLYRVGPTGTVLNTWTAITNLPFMRWSGCALDPDNNHLWVFIRDSLGGTTANGLDRAYELDVTNPASPVVIQGPHSMNGPRSYNPTPYIRFSTGGADYAQYVDKILLMNQGTPNDYIQCLKDSVPNFAGPPPGPGLVNVSWCPPDSNLLQGFGLAAVDHIGLGKIHLTNFTDGNPPHPIYVYDSPCPLAQCDSALALRVIRVGLSNTVNVYWTGVAVGTYHVWSTTSTTAVWPTGFTDDATVTGVNGLNSWTDSRAFVPYRRYVVIHVCG